MLVSRVAALSRMPSMLILKSRSYAVVKPFRCDAHMNELPVPCGNWDVHYKKKQSFYNMVLVGGFAWWLGSFALMIWTGSIYLNWGPPAQPGPPSELVDDCIC